MSTRANVTNEPGGDTVTLGRGPSRPVAGGGYGAAAYARRAAQQYRSTNVTTAGPGALVLMMYDGALRFIRQAVAAIERRDFEGANNSIGRAQDIVTELSGALDMSRGEIAENLERLYDYMYRRLVEGNVRKDTAPLKEVAGMLQELREAWAQIARGEGTSRDAKDV